jgi:DNA polymerase elongation subunit (family B)
METAGSNERVLRLTQKLSECEARFDAEARKRGFDPAQSENMALPSTLATLFTEREEIRAELEELAENQKGE